MAQANRICKTCGKQYFFCSHCDKSLNSPQWMLMWHDENCKTVFEIASDYAQGRLSKSNAKTKLNDCDLTVFYTFKENIRNIIEDILTEEITTESQTETTTKRYRGQSKKKR